MSRCRYAHDKTNAGRAHRQSDVCPKSWDQLQKNGAGLQAQREAQTAIQFVAHGADNVIMKALM
jgi:hypothetical protein